MVHEEQYIRHAARQNTSESTGSSLSRSAVRAQVLRKEEWGPSVSSPKRAVAICSKVGLS